MKNKQKIITGEDSTTVLVTQDFTHLELNGSFVRDLIFCKYFYNENSKDKLNREYRHFVGDIGDKNCINFVVGAWMTLLEENWFKGTTVIKIWLMCQLRKFQISRFASVRFIQ